MQQYLDLFQQYAQQQSFDREPKGLYAPIEYIMNIGGKRMRPVMLLMSYGLFQSDVEKALPAAYAVEIFHNFSLVHDDIMDQAPLRRGKPTVHTRWNANTGILSGDAMLVYAYDYLLKLEDTTKLPKLLQVFNQAAIGVCEGQVYDMAFEQQADVPIDTYLKMIELKTSVLLAGAMQMGAIIGGATDEDAQHVYEFGRHVGIAFQLQDDYLDTFGDPAKFGKKVGGDIAQNKKTYLILKALQLADATTKQQLLQHLSTTPADDTEKIQIVTQLLRDLGIPEHTAQKKEEYQRKAFEHLAAIKVPVEKKQALQGIATYLLDREI